MDVNTGDTAWVLISTALVLFMTPGLALFYGGHGPVQERAGMLMQNFFAMGLLAIVWAARRVQLGVRRRRQRRGHRQLRLCVPQGCDARCVDERVPLRPDDPVRAVLRISR